jgi:hypothetical protein
MWWQDPEVRKQWLFIRWHELLKRLAQMETSSESDQATKQVDPRTR